MATSDILKQSVYDARIIQPNPVAFAVNKGALSLTNAPFNAIGASASQTTFQVNVPSQNTFVDRAIDWTATVLMTAQVDVGAGAAAIPVLPAYDPVLTFGKDAALAPFPLNEMAATISATINDCTVTTNSDQVMKEVMRLTDYKVNRLVRTCPTMMDKYGSYNDAFGALNNPLASYLGSTESAEMPNGAWWNIQFCNAQGGSISQLAAGPYGFYLVGSVAVLCASINGLYYPVRTPAAPPALPAGATSWASDAAAYTVYFKWTTTEKLVLSPFIFADAHEWSVGLYAVNNIQIIITNKADVSRVIRSTTANGRTVSGVQFQNFSSTGSPYQQSKVNVQFLTPSLDLADGLLPVKSSVPYQEFPRYVSTNFAPLAAGEVATLQSSNIVLPQIPDMLIIYAKPRVYADTTVADFYLPITRISINWDNFSGLLNAHTTEQLYQMCVHNGLNMDFNEWRGYARSDKAGGALIQTVGGFLVLKLGQDITLQSGSAAGLIGNYSTQFEVTVQNTSYAAVDPILYVIAVNSGFVETMAGSSRLLKAILSESDILSAPPVEGLTRDSLQRITGAGFFSNLSSMLSKALPYVSKGVELYKASKPLGQALKGALPEGKMKDIMGAVGYGMPSGAGMAGAAMPSGAGKKMKGLSARLM